ncbi:MAG TPA: hypothetical protein VHE34_17850 [Puia sp.]|uniref:baeRF3 domain-containing protein n=1 Tax=Puia sp. TaxID=2045100 RepID=UPI002CFA9472|nr:hypothetical protein [Puia sp.]HVU97101.1 hypothetical protein [Puia sp.]
MKFSTDSRNLPAEELAASMQREKGNICISIIVPTHKLSPERRVDHLVLDKAVRAAKKYLSLNFREEEIKPLQQSVDELYQRIDFNHNAMGIGLFVSANIKELVQFFFPVKEKVIIGRSFEVRDLLYQAYYSHPYYTLLLTEKEARLFEGRLNHLLEIKDDNFPRKYVDDYIYTRPTRGSSFVGNSFVKEYEKDKSQLEEIRYQHFCGLVEDGLKHYLTNKNSVPLIIAGAKKDLSYFRMATRQTKNIIGEVEGNYSYVTTTALGDLVWEVLRPHLDKVKQQLIGEFDEKIGERRGISGIHEIWKAAKEGKGLTLLVEKDLSLPGFLPKENEYDLWLHPPKKAHQVLADAVDDLMEIVLEKSGKVILLENNSLKDHQGMALITRY